MDKLTAFIERHTLPDLAQGQSPQKESFARVTPYELQCLLREVRDEIVKTKFNTNVPHSNGRASVVEVADINSIFSSYGVV